MKYKGFDLSKPVRVYRNLSHGKKARPLSTALDRSANGGLAYKITRNQLKSAIALAAGELVHAERDRLRAALQAIMLAAGDDWPRLLGHLGGRQGVYLSREELEQARAALGQTKS